MATYDFNLDRDGIIKSALRRIGVLKKNYKPSASEIDNAADALNQMIKSWQTEDIGLWLVKEMTLYTNPGDESYSLGPSGDNASLSSVETQIATAASSGDGTIDVDSITGISDGDYIGVELDDGTLQWTTINGAPSGSTITLTAVLTDDVAVDNYVYTYTDKIQRPLDIISGRRRDVAGNDTPLNFYTRKEYFDLTDKSTSGEIHTIYYDKQLTNGVLYVYPTGTLTTDRIKLTIKYPIQDFDSSTDNAEYPTEWIETITMNLAVRMYYEYSGDQHRIDISDFTRLRADAKTLLDQAKSFDKDAGAYQFYPDMTDADIRS